MNPRTILTPRNFKMYDSEYYSRYYSRVEVREDICPRCKAKANNQCLGTKRQKRKAKHIERVIAHHQRMVNLTNLGQSVNIAPTSVPHVKIEKFTRRERKNMPTTRTVAKKTVPAKKTTTPAPSRTKRATTAKASQVPLEEEVPQKKTNTARTRKAASPAPRKTAPKTPAKKTAAPVKKTRSIPQANPNLYNPDTDANKKIQGMTYQQISDRVGIRIGSEQFIAVIELLKGGATRQEVNERVRELLPPTTINGTTKQVTNMVSAVLHRMMDLGFAVDGKYRLVLVKGTTSK